MLENTGVLVALRYSNYVFGTDKRSLEKQQRFVKIIGWCGRNRNTAIESIWCCVSVNLI